jgi:hypothetical protein
MNRTPAPVSIKP